MFSFMAEFDKSGRISRVVFTNPLNGYTVVHFVADDRDDYEVVVGVMPAVTEGDLVRVKGRTVVDRRFGRQVKAEFVEPVLPSTLHGVERYLASGVAPGVGKVTAARLVEHFGEDLVRILDEEAERLTDCPGVGRKKADSIATTWRERVQARRLLVLLYGLGVGTALATRLINVYGDRAVQTLKENPYRLAREVKGVGFLTADRLAQSVGIEKDSPFRIEAAIIYFLDTQASEGHCFYPVEQLVTEVAEFLELEVVDVEPVLKQVVDLGLLRVDSRWGGEDLYLPRLYNSESEAARALAGLTGTKPAADSHSIRAALEFGVRSSSVDLTMEQVESIFGALRNRCIIITGGPGTGKTTVIKAIINGFRSLNLEFVLCAPTGRAAKRMTETTGVDAKTIHRLLEYNPSNNSFNRDRDNPLRASAVVVDEVSMIDIELMGFLLEALAPGSRLVLVGDKDQLESVGPGAVLRDCIASGHIPCSILTEIHRQAELSLVVVNSHRILNGRWLRFEPVAGGKTDFFFMERGDPEAAVETILEMVAKRIPSRFGHDPIRDVQVITPMYKGLLGAQNLNSALQERLNPSGAELRRGERVFRPGDRVMQTKNDYDREVFNGDIGFVSQVGPEGLTVRLTDGRKVLYGDSDLDELMLAYAVTVHKSQGSEYPVVVLALHTQHFVMLRRNLLYTALTRGKDLVVLVGTRRAAETAIRKDYTRKRHTRLGERIKHNMEYGHVG